MSEGTQDDELIQSILDTATGAGSLGGFTPSEAIETADPVVPFHRVKARFNAAGLGVGINKALGNTRVSFDDVKEWWGSLDPDERAAFQYEMWTAGLYKNPASYTPEGLPQWGSAMDAASQEALFGEGGLLDTAQKSGQSAEQVLLDERRTFAPSLSQVWTSDGYYKGGVTATSDVEAITQEAARNKLGRELNDTELANASHYLQQRAAQRDPVIASGGTLPKPERTIQGGGPESSAIKAGNVLAARFGLVPAGDYRTRRQNAEQGGNPDSNHTRGLAVDLTGDDESLREFVNWAKGQRGTLFEKVSFDEDDPRHKGKVHIEFIEGAPMPDWIGEEQPATPTADTLAQAIRRSETAEDYTWRGGDPGRFGAYQVTEAQWRRMAAAGGYDPGDTSSDNQDRVVRATLDRYLRRTGSPMVALQMFHAGETSLHRYKQDPDYYNKTTDGGFTSTDWARTVLSNAGVALHTEGQPGRILSVEQDVGALQNEADDYIEENFGREESGKRLMDTISVFTGMMGQVGGGFMGGR